MRYNIPLNQLVSSAPYIPGAPGARQQVNPNTLQPIGPTFGQTPGRSPWVPDPLPPTSVPPGSPGSPPYIPGAPGATQQVDPVTLQPIGAIPPGTPGSPASGPYIPGAPGATTPGPALNGRMPQIDPLTGQIIFDPFPAPPPAAPMAPSSEPPAIPGGTEQVEYHRDPVTGQIILGPAPAPAPAPPPVAPSPPAISGGRENVEYHRDPVTGQIILGPAPAPAADSPDTVGSPYVEIGGQLTGLPWNPILWAGADRPMDLMGHVITDPAVLDPDIAVAQGLTPPVPAPAWISDIMRANSEPSSSY